jgi:uncharacterized membrane protein (UPF0136 family)
MKKQTKNPLIGTSLPTLIFGLLVGFGGLMGYLKEGSIPSLTAGTISCLALACCAYFIKQRSRGALYCALAITLALDAFFMYRFISTLQPFPAGVFSLLCLIFLTFVIFKIKKNK